MSNAFNLISVYAQSSALQYADEAINLRVALDNSERVYEYENFIGNGGTWSINQPFKCDSVVDLSFRKKTDLSYSDAAENNGISCTSKTSSPVDLFFTTEDAELKLTYEIIDHTSFSLVNFKVTSLECEDTPYSNDDIDFRIFMDGQMDMSDENLYERDNIYNGDIVPINKEYSCTEAMNFYLLRGSSGGNYYSFKVVESCNQYGTGTTTFIRGDHTEYILNWEVQGATLPECPSSLDECKASFAQEYLCDTYPCPDATVSLAECTSTFTQEQLCGTCSGGEITSFSTDELITELQNRGAWPEVASDEWCEDRGYQILADLSYSEVCAGQPLVNCLESGCTISNCSTGVVQDICDEINSGEIQTVLSALLIGTLMI